MPKLEVKREIEKNRSSIKLEPHQVIVKPLITEKSVQLSERAVKKYVFAVNSIATKVDIRRAVEKLFSVKVAKVAVQNRKGKKRRHRNFVGKTRNWKRAIVTLAGDDVIELFS
jgi:large subunit ribosomal protein L23